MAVRAKFKVSKIERQSYRRSINKGDHDKIETVEMQTVILSPVYGNGDPNHENTRFWNASPSGEIRLGTINPEAWSQFELDAEYYIDFTKAD